MSHREDVQIYHLELRRGSSVKDRWILSEPDYQSTDLSFCSSKGGGTERSAGGADLYGNRLNIIIRSNSKGEGRMFPVFSQKAENYGDYNQYLRLHGCACCCLTTVLAAYSENCRKLTPDKTIEEIERVCLDAGQVKKNYSRPVSRQMPVSLFGISTILKTYGIANRYIGSFQDGKALLQMKEHLYRGCPVIVETSRIRRRKGRIASINDRKYAGSYHTLILLGFNERGRVLFTDSADRAWAGNRQRLKEAPLDEMINYMYPQKNPADDHVYFSRRKNTGGYILVDQFLSDRDNQ